MSSGGSPFMVVGARLIGPQEWKAFSLHQGDRPGGMQCVGERAYGRRCLHRATRGERYPTMGDASIPTSLHTAPAPTHLALRGITSSPEDMGNDETRLEASANYDILRTCSSIDLSCHQQYAIVIVDVFNSIVSQRT
jgi:hypothetical protein